jgi:aspartate aminotransferase-like enzyme
MAHRKLFIPGPTEVSEDVLERMAQPLIGHRTKEASALQKSISERLQKALYTSSDILLSTSSGTGLMEGAIRSCTARRAAVFSVGSFGERWHKMAKENGVPSDIFAVEDGLHTTPESVEQALSTGKYDLVTVTHNETSSGLSNNCAEIGEAVKKFPDVVFCVDAVSSAGGMKIDTDAWGIDILITSSQKCLALPPGLSICTFSEKAAKRAENVEGRGYYFDLKMIHDSAKKNWQYPSTPSISHMYALDYQLGKILAEGLENRFARHHAMAERVRSWAREHFALFPEEEYASDTLTCVKNTRSVSVAALSEELSDRYEISNGYGSLKEKTFRIAHMGDLGMEDVNGLLGAIDKALGF